RIVARREARDIEAERAEPVGDQLEVPGLVAGLARERQLDVELARARHPRGRQLADVDLVGERDLQQLAGVTRGIDRRIDRRRLGQRHLACADDRGQPLGFPRLELFDERHGLRYHAAGCTREISRVRGRRVVCTLGLAMTVQLYIATRKGFWIASTEDRDAWS